MIYQYSGTSLQLQIQSLLDIIEFILNKLNVENLVELKATLKESIEDIVIIQNNLIETKIYNTKDDKSLDECTNEDIVKEELFEEVSAGEPLAEIETVEPVQIGILKECIDDKENEEHLNEDNNEDPIKESEPVRTDVSINSELNSSCEIVDINQRKEKTLSCPESECNESFSHVGDVHGSGLLNHMVEDHEYNVDDLLCPYCGKKNKNSWNLDYHIRSCHSKLDTQWAIITFIHLLLKYKVQEQF